MCTIATLGPHRYNLLWALWAVWSLRDSSSDSLEPETNQKVGPLDPLDPYLVQYLVHMSPRDDRFGTLQLKSQRVLIPYHDGVTAYRP